MKVEEQVPLAPLTTLKVGGTAAFFVEARSIEEVQAALALARERAQRLLVLGGGSNILVPDTGVAAVVLKIAMNDMLLEQEGDEVRVTAEAGAVWGDVVDMTTAHGLFGIENLAGIPGTMGGAAVQNIGAYGVELSETFEYADVIDSATLMPKRIDFAAAAFSYRSSLFKTHPALVVIRVALRLKTHGTLNVRYSDLVRAKNEGVSLSTPAEVATAVQVIRAEKFPDLTVEGTAGSFFKNPIIQASMAEALCTRFPGLPVFLQGERAAKVSLAWILDQVLSLKGFAIGPVRLYESQPLVIVTRRGATAREVDALAREVSKRVYAATNILIEREVETFC